MTTPRTRVALALEGGSTYPGFLITTAADNSDTDFSGEAVFTTDMFGYQREMTNPANAGKVLVFATPQIGNVGWNDEDSHPDGDGSITPAAVVMRDLSTVVSNFRATRSLADALEEAGVPGIAGVDTRGLVRTLAQAGGPVQVQGTVEKQELK